MNNGKVRSRDEIMACFKDGQTIAIGGQGGVYMPWNLVDMLAESGVKHLTIYSIDSCNPGQAIGQLVRNRQVDRMITTHVGMNPETSKQMMDGDIKVELCPMGNFIERIRCGGAGLGGVLTKTGLGTMVAEGKQIITLNGEEYLLEEALHADIALTRARRADPLGNLAYHGSGMASHPVIATCADLSIVQCDLYCDLGEISPDDVRVPGMYIDMLYTGEYESNLIKGRVARERGL
ncbi:MAG: 3-oxoacid CoA-transferase subunit A [Solobacterium sp.]|nr:3-oxoacid CoA-transferase subunit A [Solobacterium sp.]